MIDYANNEGGPGYNPSVDWPASRFGINVRDEIRMIRPGFYLGQAYSHGVFVLNFSLYRDDAGQGATVCPQGV